MRPRTPWQTRFWDKVNKNGPVLVAALGPCWVWTASTFRGYGRLMVRRGESKRPELAHRLAWELETGTLPPVELHVLHKCDNGICVRHSHHFLGTDKDNVLDMHAKGRANLSGLALGRKEPPPTYHGASHPNAKLTAVALEEIRRRRVAGERVCDLAGEFGISAPRLSRILAGKAWRTAS